VLSDSPNLTRPPGTFITQFFRVIDERKDRIGPEGPVVSPRGPELLDQERY
jgi:hypothetical protein